MIDSSRSSIASFLVNSSITSSKPSKSGMDSIGDKQVNGICSLLLSYLEPFRITSFDPFSISLNVYLFKLRCLNFLKIV